MVYILNTFDKSATNSMWAMETTKQHMQNIN